MNILRETGDLPYFMILMLQKRFYHSKTPAKRALVYSSKQIDARDKEILNPIGSAYILILKTDIRLW